MFYDDNPETGYLPETGNNHNTNYHYTNNNTVNFDPDEENYSNSPQSRH